MLDDAQRYADRIERTRLYRSVRVEHAVLLGVVASSLLWLVYGWYGAGAFSSPETSVSFWFQWTTVAPITLGIAVALGVTWPEPRGFVTAALLAAGAVLGLLAGIVLGGGFPSSGDERSFGAFALAAVVAVGLAWLLGVAVSLVLRSLHVLTLSPLMTFVVAFVAGAVIVGGGLDAVNDLATPSGERWTGRTWQRDGRGAFAINATRWDAEPHSLLPRLGRRTVALEVRHRAGSDDLEYSASQWSAVAPGGQEISPAVWPNRRPLKSTGRPLSDGTLTLPYEGTAGWLAFVVPEGVAWIDVVLEDPDGPALRWRVDRDGARVTFPSS